MAEDATGGCFAGVGKLRYLDPGVLCDFLELFPDFLTRANIDLPADRDPDRMPYEQLIDALMSPFAPARLQMQLILMDRLASEAGWQEIAFEAQLRGVPVPADIQRLCDCSRAMRMWTLAQPGHPDLLEESFARTRIYKESSYTYYLIGEDFLESYAPPDAAELRRLETRLDNHFGVREGTKVLQYDYDIETWYLIRHPGSVAWHGVYENGRITSRALTPELYDEVVYHRYHGHLRMNTHRKSDHAPYCAEFGRLLFNADGVFDPCRKMVDLEVLRGDVAALCRTGEIQGLHEIRISEVCFCTMGCHADRRVTWRAAKENGRLPPSSLNQVLPDDVDRVLYARLSYRLKPGGRWQSVTLNAGNLMFYQNAADSGVLENWLMARTQNDAQVA